MRSIGSSTVAVGAPDGGELEAAALADDAAPDDSVDALRCPHVHAGTSESATSARGLHQDAIEDQIGS
jgi:hypothetical protein